MNLNKVTVYRMPYREARLDGSIERNTREAFDILEDVDTATQLRSLIYDETLPYDTMRDKIVFNYKRNKEALGIVLDILPETLPIVYFESIVNALFERAATGHSIVLRTTTGYTTSPVNAYAFAMFCIYIDHALERVKHSSYKEDKYLASQYLKLKKSLYELIARCNEKPLKLFIGSVVNTFKPNPNEEQTVSERTIYVVESMASGFTDEEIISQFNELGN